jgi:hypothetical protein
MAQNGDEPVCQICKIIRIYLMIAVPLVIMLAVRPEMTMLRDVQLTSLVSTAIGVGFVVIVAWRAYDEFWRDR